ncbi:Ig-like domain-containing protein [Cellulomonas sp.]|uniref:Ig-like domain-containing protein n=1 Tax=Cellulomonas sp. TaxID=40001 RepID=UPI002811EF85|nr:Ig-like domain-containing protein [Cellulomonas sp.]
MNRPAPAPAAPAARRLPARLRAAAVVVVGALVVTGAVLAQGYDAQRTPAVETAVWVARDAGQYARFDTELGEIDTVRSVDDPTTVVQHGARAAVVAGGMQQLWTVDPAVPADLRQDGGEEEQSAEALATPGGTQQVAGSGDWMVFLDDTGTASVRRLDAEPTTPATPLDPEGLDAATATPEEEDEAPAEPWAADAASIDDRGRVALYGASDRTVRVLDAVTGALLEGPVEVVEGPEEVVDVRLTLVGGDWVLLDASDGRLWTSGRDEPVATQTGPGAVLQEPTSAGTSLLVADREGLVEVPLDEGEARRTQEAAGTPAPPVRLSDGTRVAAWLSAGTGTLWTSGGDPVALEVDTEALEALPDLHPVVRTNGGRAVLEETGSGALWTVPDGRAVPLSQWTARQEDDRTTGTSAVEEVTQQMPPVAMPDAFGVRPGTDVRLPVLLNDHDPNTGDVLTVDAESLSPMSDPAFASLRLAHDDQVVVATVSALEGSATFTYAVTDGTDRSEPVTVTLTVVPDDAQGPPAWCEVEGCTQTWPTAVLAPGGTARIGILDAWVDPEGDPFVLQSVDVADPTAPLQVAAGPDGSLTIRHTDPNAAAASTALTVVVADSRGGTTERTLDVAVQSAPDLAVEGTVLVVSEGRTKTIDLAPQVTSGSGRYRLRDVVPVGVDGGAGVTVAATGAGMRVQVTANTAGEHPVTFTVHDDLTGVERSALLRVRVPADDRAVVLPPTTAYVWAHEDTTVDVVSAVQGAARHVLMVSFATSDSPGLGVDVIDATALRLRATSADATPGLLGTVTVTVTDGADVRTQGTVAVFLVGPVTGQGVVAQPDVATVRAGGTVDIPVTDNDVAPMGGRTTLLPDLVTSGTPGELAFVSGGTVRYVAPETPGTYTVGYDVAWSQDTARTSSATVTVTVVDATANRPPVAPVLEGRVVAGGTVRIPFDAAGTDPDGDAVTLVGVGRPEPGQGAATVEETGDGLRFVAPSTLNPGQQVTFSYTLRDSRGATSTGTVRVGVLPAGARSGAPVAYVDYVRVTAGQDEPVTIEPLANDREPDGGRLTLTALRPDALPGGPEAARLDALVDDAGTSLEDGVVVLRAGDVLGVHAYVYTVTASDGVSTAEGLVVVEVVADATGEQPFVADTVVTLRDRDQLAAGGVDVVDGKVRWASGRPGDLRLSVWGEAASTWTASGTRISGPLPRGGAVVPFVLEGTDARGTEVRAYGLLRVPAFDDMRLTTYDDLDPLAVDEDATGETRLSSVVQAGRGDRLEVRTDTQPVVQRAAARCTVTADGILRYAAGAGAPWQDTCTVGVRVVGQETWTDVLVPVEIRPAAPQAVLAPVSRTVAPGATETIDLASMLSWEGGRVGDEASIVFTTSLSGAGGSLELQQDGRTLSVTARAGAVPGTRATVTVRVAQYGGLQSTVDLLVGAAPTDAPRGATIAATCNVADGSGCTIPVVGVAGEYDPFAGKPGAGLELAQVGSAGTVACAVATVSAGDRGTVRVSWPSGSRPAGGTCTVPFTVRDAQGRLGAGRVDLDVLGYPAQPGSLTLSSYTASSVVLDLALGEAARAHPAVSGVTVYQDGAAVGASCSPAGASTYRCTVGGLRNGEPHTYTARVRNAVGESPDSTPAVGWAYAAPAVGAVRAETVYDPARTTPTSGVARVTIAAGDDARAFRVSGVEGEVPRSGRGETTVDVVLPVGAQTITVTPLSRFTPPNGGTDASGSPSQASVTVAGSPRVTGGAARPADRAIVVDGASVDPNGSAAGTSLRYGAFLDGSQASCTMGRDGQAQLGGGRGVVSDSPTIGGLENDEEYSVVVCGSNGFGAARVDLGRVVVFTGFDPPAVRRGWSVGGQPRDLGGGEVGWLQVQAPRVDATQWNTVAQVRVAGGEWRDPSAFEVPRNVADPSVEARQCSRFRPQNCSPAVPVPREGNVRGTVTARFPVGQCIAEPSARDVELPEWARESAQVTVTQAERRGRLVTTWSLDWTGALSDLQDVALDNASAGCPPPAPDPEPEPEPTEPTPTEPPAAP